MQKKTVKYKNKIVFNMPSFIHFSSRTEGIHQFNV